MGSDVCKTQSLNTSNVINMSLSIPGSLAGHTKSLSRTARGRAEVGLRSRGSCSHLGLCSLTYWPGGIDEKLGDQVLPSVTAMKAAPPE